jgi:sugar lactone lactonase YvrE
MLKDRGVRETDLTKKPEHNLSVQNEMGESPVWDPSEQVLYWIDIEGESICRLDPENGKYDYFKVEMPVTALGRRASGGWITVTKSGLAFWDPSSKSFQFIIDPFEQRPDFRFNDGVVDRQGRFLTGSFNQKVLDAPEGSLYRLDKDLSLHQIATGLVLPNGLGLSPDGNTLYVNEMFKNRILRYNYDTTSGTVSAMRIFAEVPEKQGMPDGLTVDSEGYVWIALWGGWKVIRFDPEGNVDREVRLPCEIVTCMGFGGRDMDELFITTAWYSIGGEARKKQPLAGDLFRVKTDVMGLIEPCFAG